MPIPMENTSPFCVLPFGPVPAHEVSINLPVSSNHRRNRHAPLTRSTEYMRAMYSQPSPHSSEGPSKPTEDKCTHPQSTNPQERLVQEVYRPYRPAPARSTQNLQTPTPAPALRSIPNFARPLRPAASTPNLSSTRAAKPHPRITVPKRTSSRRQLPSRIPAANTLKPLPPIPSLSVPTPTKPSRPCKSAMTGPITPQTALHSNPLSQVERDHEIWLSEGWKLWRLKKEERERMMRLQRGVVSESEVDGSRGRGRERGSARGDGRKVAVRGASAGR